MTHRKRVASALIAFALVLAGAALFAGWAAPHLTALRKGHRSAAGPSRFPNVSLTNQEGRKLRFYDDLLRGKVVLINFIFTRCQSQCPMATANLARVQRLLGDRLGRDVHIISITVDPEYDTPARLAEFARPFAPRPGWQLVTGSAGDIALIRRALGVFERNPALDQDKSQHTGMIVFGNEAQDRWSMLYSLAEPEEIVRAVSKWVRS